MKHLLTWFALGLGTAAAADVPAVTVLDDARASAFARLVLKNIDREYPNKPGEVLRGPEDIMSPRAMHPAFFGSYDWHSCVHGHWLLVRLLRLRPGLAEAA